MISNNYKGCGQLDTLDLSNVSDGKRCKNRSILILVDRSTCEMKKLLEEIKVAVETLLKDEVDTITIDVRIRTWW